MVERRFVYLLILEEVRIEYTVYIPLIRMSAYTKVRLYEGPLIRRSAPPIILNVIMLCVVMLNVVAPSQPNANVCA